MIDPELRFDKHNFLYKLRKNYQNDILPKHIIELAESIPNFEWEPYGSWCTEDEFIQWCKDQGIENRPQFFEWCRNNIKPNHVPYDPTKIYDDFKWGKLSGRYRNVKWVSKEKFIQWCKDNGIKTSTSFTKWCKENIKPKNIPFKPLRTYDNWSWSELSGYYNGKDRNYISKEEFIQWCKDNSINNSIQFAQWKEKNIKPLNIPVTPNSFYKNFQWGELSGRYRNNNWYSKKKFIQWCKKNGIKTKTSFTKWCKKNKRPKNIPSIPNRIYKNWSWNNVT